MIQLSITSDGLSAKTRNSDLIFTRYIAGSGVDANNEEIQIQKQIIPISFSQIYNAGDTYTLNGSSYVEEIDHIKIVGTLLSSEASNDYALKEIALMAKEGADGEEFTFAYGANGQSGITILQNENTSYSLVMDIIFDTTPNVSVNATGTGVTYSDLITHTNGNVLNSTIHGIKYENDDLKINNVNLDICKNNIFQKTIGVTVYNSLPTASMAYNDLLVFNKATNSLYKCVKSTVIEVGDYIYEDNSSWAVGDGTENGALEVVADSATPSVSEIKLTDAQSYFMEWASINNFNKRLALVENVSLGGITTIIDSLQAQINTLLNAQQSPFPAWKGSTTYAVGDICIANTFKSYQYLECVVAGESSATMPSYVDVGQMITDNEVKWLVCDFRDSAPVGTYKTDVVQRKGWLKANGATVNRADYPRLWAWVEANSLSVPAANIANNPGKFGQGDGSTTFTMPNFEDYFIRYSFTRIRGTVQASQMAQHNHSCGNQDTSHTHTLGNQSANHKHSIGNQSASHQHTINDNTAEHNHTSGNQSASHNHTYTKPTFTSIPVGSTSPVIYTLCTGSETKNTGNQSANHNHTINNKSITHKHTMGNQDTSHTHTLGNQDTAHTHSIGNQSASHKHSIGNTGSGDNTYPTNLAMQMYIKY